MPNPVGTNWLIRPLTIRLLWGNRRGRKRTRFDRANGRLSTVEKSLACRSVEQFGFLGGVIGSRRGRGAGDDFLGEWNQVLRPGDHARIDTSPHPKDGEKLQFSLGSTRTAGSRFSEREAD
jgi:hypothetical protein